MTWKLDTKDIVEAIKEWLQNNHDVDADGADVKLVWNGNTGEYDAIVEGTVTSFSMGPYR